MRLSNTDRRLMISAITNIIDAALAFEDSAVIERMKHRGSNDATVVAEFRALQKATSGKSIAAVQMIFRSIGRNAEADLVAVETFMHAAALTSGSPEITDLIEHGIRRCEEMHSAVDQLGDLVGE